LNGKAGYGPKSEYKQASDVSLITPRVFPAISWPKIERACLIEYRGLLLFNSFYLYLAMAVRLEAPLAVGFVEDPLAAAFGAP
jgi:hypothetical protein